MFVEALRVNRETENDLVKFRCDRRERTVVGCSCAILGWHCRRCVTEERGLREGCACGENEGRCDGE